jgi:hypothetical protein
MVSLITGPKRIRGVAGGATKSSADMFRTISIALTAAVLVHASAVTIEGFANTLMQDNFDAGVVPCDLFAR